MVTDEDRGGMPELTWHLLAVGFRVGPATTDNSDGVYFNFPGEGDDGDLQLVVVGHKPDARALVDRINLGRVNRGYRIKRVSPLPPDPESDVAIADVAARGWTSVILEIPAMNRNTYRFQFAGAAILDRLAFWRAEQEKANARRPLARALAAAVPRRRRL